jgi:hypothetical protein
LATRAVTLVSRGLDGRPAGGTSINPAVSRDGRFVAFQSDAANLECTGDCRHALEDINLLPDVFVFDRTTSRVTRVSTGLDRGWIEESAAPALDAAGQVVAFSSKHPIHAADTNHDFDLFVRVLTAGR